MIERGDSYYVVYTYEDDDGNKKQKWETYHSEAEANRRKSEIEYHQEIGKIIVPHCETLNDLLEELKSSIMEKISIWLTAVNSEIKLQGRAYCTALLYAIPAHSI